MSARAAAPVVKFLMGSDLPGVFKIFTREQWNLLCETSEFAGSEDDVRDGYIHLSFAHQVIGSLRKHFAGQTDLVVARLTRSRLGLALVLENSRGGQAFPHLYRKMLLDDVEQHLSSDAFVEQLEAQQQ